MDDDRLTKVNRYQVAGLGILVSAIVALSATLLILLLIQRRRADQPERAGDRTASPRMQSDGADDQPDLPPIQPAVDVEMPARVPHHFTEDLIIPGFTETGQDVERQNETA